MRTIPHKLQFLTERPFLPVTHSIIFACSYWYILCFWFLLQATSVISIIHQEFEIKRVTNTEFPEPSSSLNEKERNVLLEEFLQTLQDDSDISSGFSSWFMWKNSRRRLRRDELSLIRSENCKEWLAWAFFAQDHTDELDSHVLSEIDSMLERFEQVLDTSFIPGHDDGIRYSAFSLQY
jgi:hypothetical protein